MMKLLKCLTILSCAGLTFSCGHLPTDELISFYNVPLECGAAPEIGCGSRIKPLFIDLEKETLVSEAWTNREGTVLAIKWKNKADEGGAKTNLVERLFKKHHIGADHISETKIKDSLQAALDAAGGKWLKGMAVDSLSLYEAGVIAHRLSDFAREAELISQEEHNKICADLETYFKKELVKVRTDDELRSEDTQGKWYEDGFMIYENHIGKERTEAVSRYFNEHQGTIMQQESCCSEEDGEACGDKDKKRAITSEITCPKCGFKKIEKMRTDMCVLKYTCKKCNTELNPKKGDCCVYCSYGDHKCPSKQ